MGWNGTRGRANSLLVSAVAAGILGLIAPADAGEVQFKNGDRLTGKVTAMDGGQLVVESAVAGKITVDMKDVATFSTDEPVELHLSDGSVVKGKVTTADAGKVATEPGALAAQELTLDSVKTINPDYTWNGSLRAGGLITQGNSETQQLAVGADLSRRGPEDRIGFGGQYLYGRQEDPETGNDSTTTDNWNVFGKYDYFLNEKLYLFALAKLEKDRIANLDLRFSPSAGVGYQWLEGPTANFNTEAGLGWVYEDFRNAGSNDYFAARFAYHYDRVLREGVRFIHNLEFLPSVEDPSEFNLNTDAGVRVTLVEDMFTEFKVEWKHDSEPAPDASKDDLRYVLSVGWEL